MRRIAGGGCARTAITAEKSHLALFIFAARIVYAGKYRQATVYNSLRGDFFIKFPPLFRCAQPSTQKRAGERPFLLASSHEKDILNRLVAVVHCSFAG